MSAARIDGLATRAGTDDYSSTFGAACGAGHFSDFLNVHLKLSSLGLGTFPGAASDAVDEAYARIVCEAACAGINVFDTAAHYRYGRSARALGEGLRRAFAAGVGRAQVFVVGKGGFVTVAGPPATRADAPHLLTPEHLALQLAATRDALGLDTLDAFLVDQPEVHVAALGKERMHRQLAAVFVMLEDAVARREIGCYGVSSFASFRVETDAAAFQSISALIGLAEQAAAAVHGTHAHHAFRIIQLPFNQAMTEGFTRFSQATGQGNVASTIQAAHQLRVYVMASHTLGKGLLARTAADAVRAAFALLPNDAQRAFQFSRSTPGIGTALAGISDPEHLADLLAVARTAPMARADYLRLYEKA